MGKNQKCHRNINKKRLAQEFENKTLNCFSLDFQVRQDLLVDVEGVAPPLANPINLTAQANHKRPKIRRNPTGRQFPGPVCLGGHVIAPELGNGSPVGTAAGHQDLVCELYVRDSEGPFRAVIL